MVIHGLEYLGRSYRSDTILIIFFFFIIQNITKFKITITSRLPQHDQHLSHDDPPNDPTTTTTDTRRRGKFIHLFTATTTTTETHDVNDNDVGSGSRTTTTTAAGVIRCGDTIDTTVTSTGVDLSLGVVSKNHRNDCPIIVYRQEATALEVSG